MKVIRRYATGIEKKDTPGVKQTMRANIHGHSCSMGMDSVTGVLPIPSDNNEAAMLAVLARLYSPLPPRAGLRKKRRVEDRHQFLLYRLDNTSSPDLLMQSDLSIEMGAQLLSMYTSLATSDSSRPSVRRKILSLLTSSTHLSYFNKDNFCIDAWKKASFFITAHPLVRVQYSQVVSIAKKVGQQSSIYATADGVSVLRRSRRQKGTLVC